VAAPLRRSAEESPPVDPAAVDRAYRLERAKRRARTERERQRRRASVRFSITLLVLLALALVLGAIAWREIEHLFGI
jgi:hypothetical protein